MIVRSLDEITGTERDVITPNWRSKRIVLGGDRVGFSLHETVLDAGSVNDFWYANHIEAVFVVEGDGELYDKDNDVTYQLRPGSMYLLNGHEHHQLRPKTRMRTVCVFNPPVTGREVHDENGVYPLIATEDELASREIDTEDELASREIDTLDQAAAPTIEGGATKEAS